MTTQKQSLKTAIRAGHFTHNLTPFDGALFALQAFEQRKRSLGVSALTVKGARGPLPSRINDLAQEYENLKMSIYNFSGVRVKSTLPLISTLLDIMQDTPLSSIKQQLENLNGHYFEIQR